jgi:hypothetical protein
MTEREAVPPSSEPDAATATGTGRDASGATPPPPAEESASTRGLGSEEQLKKGASAPPGDAPLDLTPDENDASPRSDSGT